MGWPTVLSGSWVDEPTWSNLQSCTCTGSSTWTFTSLNYVIQTYVYLFNFFCLKLNKIDNRSYSRNLTQLSNGWGRLSECKHLWKGSKLSLQRYGDYQTKLPLCGLSDISWKHTLNYRQQQNEDTYSCCLHHLQHLRFVSDSCKENSTIYVYNCY